MNLSALAGILAAVLGSLYTIQALLLPNASIGNPFAPKIFPIGVGMLMVITGIVLTVREIRQTGLNEKGTKEKSDNETRKFIAYISGACILYGLTFNHIGYVFSTILFLEIILTLFNGKKNWKVNTIVSVCFSSFIYIVFTKLLGITLPVMPFINF